MGSVSLRYSRMEFHYTIDAMMTMFAIMTLDSWSDRVHALYEHRPWTIVGRHRCMWLGGCWTLVCCL